MIRSGHTALAVYIAMGLFPITACAPLPKPEMADDLPAPGDSPIFACDKKADIGVIPLPDTDPIIIWKCPGQKPIKLDEYPVSAMVSPGAGDHLLNLTVAVPARNGNGVCVSDGFVTIERTGSSVNLVVSSHSTYLTGTALSTPGYKPNYVVSGRQLPSEASTCGNDLDDIMRGVANVVVAKILLPSPEEPQPKKPREDLMHRGPLMQTQEI